MESNYKTVEKIANQGYDLDLGIVLEKSFETYKKVAGIAGIGFIIVSIALSVLFIGIFGAFFGLSNFTETMVGFQSGLISSSAQITVILSSAIFAAVFSPITAGFLKMSQLASTNQNFGMENIFHYFKPPHFKDLFIAALLISVIGNIINFALVYFHIILVGNLVVGLIAFFTFLNIPLIIFSNLNAIEAITMSFKLVIKKPLIIFALILIGLIFAMLGFVAFCIGLFFTLPFYYVMHFTLYNEIIPATEVSELEEIGTSEQF